MFSQKTGIAEMTVADVEDETMKFSICLKQYEKERERETERERES